MLLITASARYMEVFVVSTVAQDQGFFIPRFNQHFSFPHLPVTSLPLLLLSFQKNQQRGKVVCSLF